MMKVSASSSALVASVLAASTAALSTSHPTSSVQELGGRKGGDLSLEKEKFAPRFDGLKFIETLVTAHR